MIPPKEVIDHVAQRIIILVGVSTLYTIMPDHGPRSSTLSQASILGLKALTADHVDRFAKEGKASVRAQPRGSALKDKASPLHRHAALAHVASPRIRSTSHHLA